MIVPSFTVTAAGQKVPLDKDGAGQAAFTVTNTSSKLGPRTGPRLGPSPRRRRLVLDNRADDIRVRPR